jgi:phosphoribosylaminoimidazole-succinocarboxamide synthase
MKNLLNILLINKTTEHRAVTQLHNDLIESGFTVKVDSEINPQYSNNFHIIYVAKSEFTIENNENNQIKKVILDNPLLSPIEQVVSTLPIDFDALPLVTEGESKILRRLTEKLLVERFKPTVYSFTHNRYGNVEGTDAIRARFSAEIFRRMSHLPPESDPPRNAFVALLETPLGPLTVQRQVETSNLEVRVKRFHIGSPLHRYRYTERFDSTQTCGAVKRWSRFDQPVVCFDWRNPLTDDQGCRLSDEPLSDDYAAVWMENVTSAKQVARKTFEWMEQLFADAGLLLVDICFFIDRSGKIIFGEISPDCMRVKELVTDMNNASAFDKDIWRHGFSPDVLKEQYEKILDRLFSQS